MAEADDETAYLVVVGMNRPRLNKILSLVHEKRSIQQNEHGATHEPSSVAKLSVTLVPCLTSMGSYEDENNNMIRYLSNVVCLDGSPMTRYFDDNSFRDHLRTVLLIGYEWQDQDTDKIEAYFKANQLEVEIECVTPNPEFETLHDEMEAFKTFDEERKEQCLSDGYMGPGKMAKSIMDAIEKIENEKIEEAKRKLEEAEAKRVAMIQQEEAMATIEVDSRRQTQHDPANPDLPRYACRMCRTILFGENHLAQDHLQHLHSFKKWSNSPVKVACQSIFCTDSVLAWLSPSGQDIEGKLACPKCLHKVGHWKWAGAQCSCGTWVTPAIQIPVSKVDVVPPQSESQGVTLVGVVTPAFMASPRV